MSTTGFQVRQADDVVPVRTLAAVACVSIVIGVGCVVVSGHLESVHVATLRGGVRSFGAPAPSGTVERTLSETSERGRDTEARARKALDSYGWLDREHGIATIPIDRAIDLTVEHSR